MDFKNNVSFRPSASNIGNSRNLKIFMHNKHKCIWNLNVWFLMKNDMQKVDFSVTGLHIHTKFALREKDVKC